MKLNQIDAGGSHPWPDPKSAHTQATIFIEGVGQHNYARGNSHLPHTFQFWVRAPSAIGGSAAGSPQALRYLLIQIQELVKNPDLQPVYLQPLVTDEPGAYSSASEFDGWYWLDAFDAPYRNNVNSGIVKATLQATPAGPAAVRRVGQSFVGGALSTTYGGTSRPWVAFPVNSTPAVNSTTRTGAEGAIPIWINPAINPAPFVIPPTIADLFKGGCRVYDTLTVAGNAVPISGIPINTNWVEVCGPEHVFTGDIVVHNGLSLQRYQIGVSATMATLWLWNTQLATPAWQQYGTLNYVDSASNNAVLRQISFDRVSFEEVQLKAVGWTSAGNEAIDLIRLQRAAFGPRIEFRPQSQANTSLYSVAVTLVTGPKIVFNSASVVDRIITGGHLGTTTDYGYAGAIITNASYPFIAGLLWQNIPANQPAVDLGVGDSTGPGQNLSRQYGVFAIPFPTPQNLQAEAESGVLGTGWTSQAGAGGNSNALEARCASGTLTGNADTFGTAWAAGTALGSGILYDVLFRVKVTSAAGATPEMKLGIWYVGGASFAVSTTFRANQVGTSYTWLLAAQGWNPNSFVNTFQFRAETTATLGTDWFIDEAVLIPVTNGVSGPRDLWQQFLADRRVELSLA